MEPKILCLVRDVDVSLFEVNLPYGLTCSQCVVQWTYYTGNTWGICANGTEGEQMSVVTRITLCTQAWAAGTRRCSETVPMSRLTPWSVVTRPVL